MSSPTDWYDTSDPNEYIGPAPLNENMGQQPKPKTGMNNMRAKNVSENTAKEAFRTATGFTPELPAVIEWAKQCLTDFEIEPNAEWLDFERVLADYADTEAGRNSYYLNALIAADGGIWVSSRLDDYGFGHSDPSGALQMDEVLTAYTYEVTCELILAFVDMLSREVKE